MPAGPEQAVPSLARQLHIGTGGAFAHALRLGRAQHQLDSGRVPGLPRPSDQPALPLEDLSLHSSQHLQLDPLRSRGEGRVGSQAWVRGFGASEGQSIQWTDLNDKGHASCTQKACSASESSPAHRPLPTIPAPQLALPLIPNDMLPHHLRDRQALSDLIKKAIGKARRTQIGRVRAAGK